MESHFSVSILCTLSSEGIPLFGRSRAADIPLHDSLFVGKGMCGHLNDSHIACSLYLLVCSYLYILMTH